MKWTGRRIRSGVILLQLDDLKKKAAFRTFMPEGGFFKKNRFLFPVNFFVTVNGAFTKLLFNSQKLVIFSHPVRPA